MPGGKEGAWGGDQQQHSGPGEAGSASPGGPAPALGQDKDKGKATPCTAVTQPASQMAGPHSTRRVPVATRAPPHYHIPTPHKAERLRGLLASQQHSPLEHKGPGQASHPARRTRKTNAIPPKVWEQLEKAGWALPLSAQPKLRAAVEG